MSRIRAHVKRIHHGSSQGRHVGLGLKVMGKKGSHGIEPEELVAGEVYDGSVIAKDFDLNVGTQADQASNRGATTGTVNFSVAGSASVGRDLIELIG